MLEHIIPCHLKSNRSTLSACVTSYYVSNTNLDFLGGTGGCLGDLQISSRQVFKMSQMISYSIEHIISYKTVSGFIIL